MAPLLVAPGVILQDHELSWTAVRSGGPGGQNVNKVSTKVELRFALGRCTSLPEAARARLVGAQRHRLDAEGSLIVTCDVTRSQARNLELARQKLATWVEACLRAPRARKATKPTRASKERRLATKARTGQKKAARRAAFD